MNSERLNLDLEWRVAQSTIWLYPSELLSDPIHSLERGDIFLVLEKVQDYHPAFSPYYKVMSGFGYHYSTRRMIRDSTPIERETP